MAPTAGARAGHGAVLDDPRGGWDLNPAIESFAVEYRLGLLAHGIGNGVGQRFLFGRLRSREGDHGPAKPRRARHCDSRRESKSSHRCNS